MAETIVYPNEKRNKKLPRERLYKMTEDTLTIYVGMDLDHHNADIIREQTDWYLTNYKIKNIVFDFENTNFMDSSGIGMIMGRYKTVKGFGGEIGVINVTENVDRILRISGLYKIVKTY
ncbi:MAG: anti-sigma factor antagonist [Eubacterium sp.]